MPTYLPEVFNVESLTDAKRIILTDEDVGTEVRWARETPYLQNKMLEIFPPNSMLLDFGCGIGRLAKAWLDHTGGHVLGVDISVPMRQLAPGYVQNERFATCSPEVLTRLVAAGARFDGGVACWAIQHVLDPAAVIEQLNEAIKTDGRLLVVNNIRRAVPTDKGWVDDGFDVAEALGRRFELEHLGKLPPTASSEAISRFTYVALYRKH